MPDTTSNPSPPKIHFNDPPPLGQSGNDVNAPKPVGNGDPAPAISAAGSSKIRTFGGKADHVEKWMREPNTTGKGATHVRTFHSKLNNESLVYMDEQINEWLAKHPEVDVKFVSSTVGMFAGKVKEAALLCQVWV